VPLRSAAIDTIACVLPATNSALNAFPGGLELISSRDASKTMSPSTLTPKDLAEKLPELA
jgi:hypothetical protein